MFSELIEKVFGILTSNTNKNVKSSSTRISNRVKNATSPLEFKSKNVVLPNNKTEKEIQNLYAEIRELQAQNKEKADKKRLLSL